MLSLFANNIIIVTQVNEIRATDVELIGKLKKLEQSYSGLKNSTSIMFATVSEMQNQQQVNKIKLLNSFGNNITTETDRGATGAIKFIFLRIRSRNLSGCKLEI